jgi:DNA-binding NarL/FixJ family response regulator
VTIRLVLADDHPLMLDALGALFTVSDDFEVAARCRDGEEAVQAVRRHRPDVLVLDLRMPRLDGLGVLRALRDETNPPRVVVLTAAVDEDEVLEALRLGVRGMVLKEMAPEMLVRCVRRVHAGGEWLERESVGRAIDKMLRKEEAEKAAAEALTTRELEVVKLVAAGLRNKEIADRLSIGEGTVKIHLHRVYEKLGVDGRVPLANLAHERGWV